MSDNKLTTVSGTNSMEPKTHWETGIHWPKTAGTTQMDLNPGPEPGQRRCDMTDVSRSPQLSLQAGDPPI